MPRIDKPNEGEGVKAQWGRDVADGLNTLRVRAESDPQAADRLTVSQRGSNINLLLRKNPHRLFLGVTKSAGPNSEADYTDERYWVQEEAITGGATPQAKQTFANMTYSTDTRCRYVTATNRSEALAGTHLLPVGSHVGPIDVVRDSDGVPHYFFSSAPPGLPLAVKIAAVGTLTGDILTSCAEGAGVYDNNDGDHWPVVDLGNGCPKVGDVYPCIGFDGTNYFIATAFARLRGLA